MGQSGLIEELNEILKGDNLAMKFNAVVVAKILVTGNGEFPLNFQTIERRKIIKSIQCS